MVSSFILISTTVVGSFYNRQIKNGHARSRKSSETAEPSLKILSNWLPKDSA